MRHGGGRGRGPSAITLRRSRPGDDPPLSHELVVHGATLGEAFIEAALATFAALTGMAPRTAEALTEVREVREVRAHGVSLEALLDRWIAECCYVHEVEGFVGRAIEFSAFTLGSTAGGEPMRLHAFLHGDALVESESASSIRAISAADGSIRATAEGFEIRLQVET